MKPISGLSDEDYLELLKNLTEHQYDEPEECTYDKGLKELYDEIEYSPRPKMKLFDPAACSNLSSATLEAITLKLHTTGNISVGPFIIRIKKYDASKPAIQLDVDIMEEKSRAFNGQPGKITEKVNMIKDSRFYNKTWIKYFNNPIKYGSKVPLETVADIVKYLQFVYKNPAFL